MIVAGGTYIEECASPRFVSLLGSGGRAALALQNLTPVIFHTFYPDAEEIAANFGVLAVTHVSRAPIKFHYLHPLSRPQIFSPLPIEQSSVQIVGDSVLRFGCVEGDFVIRAEKAVYDPQGSQTLFGTNGSRADRLVVVLNAVEAHELTGESDILKAGTEILGTESAEAVVIKRGTAGALVFSTTAELRTIPAFRTNAVNKVGSGDIFSAMLSYYWADQGQKIEEAVALASRQTADYVQTRILQRPAEPPILEPVFGNPTLISVLIVADEESTPALWLVDEARTALFELGVENIVIADRHLGVLAADWLRDRNVVLAFPQISDGFSASVACAADKAGLPCIAFTEAADTRSAFARAKAVVVEDFAGSIYSTIWTQS